MIYLNIKSEFRTIIVNLRSMKSVWLKFKEHFEPDNKFSHMQLFTELCSSKIDRNESVDLFAVQLRRTEIQ